MPRRRRTPESECMPNSASAVSKIRRERDSLAGEGLLALTLLLIVFFMVEGFSKLIFALTIRPFPNWGWVLASGVIGILLSFYLWANLPVTAIWLLGVLIGIQLICEGAALGYLAWQVRQTIRPNLGNGAQR